MLIFCSIWYRELTSIKHREFSGLGQNGNIENSRLLFLFQPIWAFDLRYQKYLYDYECEKEGLSSPGDLQQAIDGNRREGRRNNSTSAAFPGINYSINHPPSLLAKHVNGSLAALRGTPSHFSFPIIFTFFNMVFRITSDDDGGINSSVAVSTHQAMMAAAYRADQLVNFEVQAQKQLERAQK